MSIVVRCLLLCLCCLLLYVGCCLLFVSCLFCRKLLDAVRCRLLVVCCLLSACLLFVVCRLANVSVGRLLLIVECVLFGRSVCVASRSLYVVFRWLLFVGLSFVVRRLLLFVVAMCCCVLFVVCCS